MAQSRDLHRSAHPGLFIMEIATEWDIYTQGKGAAQRMEDIQPAKHHVDTTEEKVGGEIAIEEKNYNNPTSGTF